MKLKFVCCFILFIGIVYLIKAQELHPSYPPPFIADQHSAWVDSVFSTLSPDERIAQLIVVAAYSNRGPEHRQEILKLIQEQKIGGLIFFQGGPGRQAKLVNAYQEASKVPLLIAMDAEWGLGMRLDSTITYPFQMTLGAIRENNLIYQMGLEVGREMKRAGVHVNFAPVVDINNNPKNPVINYRSFGEDKHNVAQKGIAYMNGMQDKGILATAKHFPGHGDTGTDSHLALPQINHSRERLDTLELYPFREMINAGVGGVMVAHLNIPALDSTKNLPSTLSKPIITGLLKNELGFHGLIVTDAMNMKGVTGSNPPGVVDKDALLAGNDVLEFTEDVAKTISEVRKAINQGLITQDEIDERCRKVLAAKEWAGLDHYQPIALKNIDTELNTPTGQLLNRKLMEAALTVLNNKDTLMPIRRLDTLQIASLSFGASRVTPFQKMLSLYTGVRHFVLPNNASQVQVDQVKTQLKQYGLIIAGIHDESKYPRNNVSLSVPAQNFISELAQMHHTIFAVFKNPYVLASLKNIEQADGLVMTYQDNDNAEELAAQLIFGGVSASGRLPVSIGDKYALEAGMDVEGHIRFNYTLPEDAGMNSETLYSGVDSLVHEAIEAKAIPGCEVLVARNKKVVMYKAYGLQDYSDTIKVDRGDLYDLASITKVSASLPALMRLYDEGKFDLDASIDDYLPYFKHSNKADVPFRDILAHQARFKPYIVFWQNTLRKNGSYKWFTIKPDSSRRFPIKLTDHMWLHRHYKKKIFKAIKKSPLEDEKKYLYSGLAFFLIPTIVEKLTGEDFDTYLNKTFYDPLGATTLDYLPSKKFPLNRIVPTEDDYLFRHKPVHGTVHDEGASMMAGISGNAGLFADANDLAKLMQMYLDRGAYGGQQYIKAATIHEFTIYQFPENGNRRGLGFDKPNLEYLGEDNNTARDASVASFGHTGFTGTFAWMDPSNGLLYIFLSNRVLPTRNNTRLYHFNTRTQIQQVLYDAMEEKQALLK